MQTHATILLTDKCLRIEPKMQREFTIDLCPTVKGRPRFSRKTGRAFTPEKTRSAERETADLLEKVYQYDIIEKGTPIAICLTFYLPRPKSASKEKRPWPDVRPDVDNFVKLALDAMQGIVFEDDSQIIECNCRKLYADAGEPRTEVVIGLI